MRPTDNLKDEHTAIKLMLQILDKVCQELESGKEVNYDHLTQIVDFIKIFADKCHHGKEEDLLFPSLERTGMPHDKGPISIMLMEHNIGRNYVGGMSEAADKYKAGNRQESARFVENARNYIALLTQHIRKENEVLFPMADMRLSEEDQKRLLEDFEKLETERIGIGKHEELHRLLHHLKDIYLK